jgi:streptogrisin C
MKLRRRVVAAAVSVGVLAALTATTGVSAAPPTGLPAPGNVVAEASSSNMWRAMAQALDMSTDEARYQLVREAVATRTALLLRQQVGASYAGSWLTDHQELVVAVTDARQAAQVRAAGATPAIASRSMADLDVVATQLTQAAAPYAGAITGWQVDVRTNTVEVLAKPGQQAIARAFIDSSGVPAEAIRLQVTDWTPELLYDVRGGDAYYNNELGVRCSVGFSVNGGYVTAGHCGWAGNTTRGHNHVTQGVFQGRTYPGSDHGWVSVNSNWTPRPLVNRYSGGQTEYVTGSMEALVGATVCRSGSTTGWRCGTITHKNVTVWYPNAWGGLDRVDGLTRTTACGEPGDSGGPFLWGTQAQGVTSGRSGGDCNSGGATYFQPIWPILSAYNLKLLTYSDPTPPPAPIQ